MEHEVNLVQLEQRVINLENILSNIDFTSLTSDIKSIKEHVDNFAWFSITVNQWRDHLFWKIVKTAVYMSLFYFILNCEFFKDVTKTVLKRLFG